MIAEKQKTIQQKKIELAQEILAMEDERAVDLAYVSLHPNGPEKIVQLTEAEMASIEKGLADAKAGKVRSWEEVQKRLGWNEE